MKVSKSVLAVTIYILLSLTFFAQAKSLNNQQIITILNLLDAFDVPSTTVAQVEVILKNDRASTPYAMNNIESGTNIKDNEVINGDQSSDTYMPSFCLNPNNKHFTPYKTSPYTFELQKALQIFGYFIYPELTNYYGDATRQAVERFQCKHLAICSGDLQTNGYGLAGPLTKHKICGLLPVYTVEINQQSDKMSQNTLANIFNRNLYVGTKGEDVKLLQRLLKQTGDYRYPELTGYFGNVTKTAVQRYQCRELNICSGDEISTGYGVFGPLTRSHLIRKQSIVVNEDDNSTNNTNNYSTNKDCVVGDVTIKHNTSKIFYDTSSSEKCSSHALTRKCENGVLLGDTSYKYLNCSTTVISSDSSSYYGSSDSTGSSIAYFWDVADWSTCVNNQQTREVVCKGSDNNVYADNMCTGIKPVTERVCVSTNSPPVIQGITGPVTTSVNANNTFVVDAIDADGDNLEYAVKWDTGEEQSDWQTSNIFTKIFGIAKTYAVLFFARDGRGGVVSTSTDVIVASINCVATDGSIVQNGGQETRIRYASSTVPYGQACQQETQTRICENGSWTNWSGTYTHDSCVEEPTYFWSASPWSECNPDNTQTRIVTCMGSDGLEYADSYCTTDTKPTTTQACVYSYTAPGENGYDIIIVAGQSNAVGYGGPYFYDPYSVEHPEIDALIKQIGRYADNDNKIIPATFQEVLKDYSGNAIISNGQPVYDDVKYDALEHWEVGQYVQNKTRHTMGLAIPFARRYAFGSMTGNRQVLIIPAAYGGSSIKEWLGYMETDRTRNAGGSLYDDMKARIEIALNAGGEDFDNRIVTFIWQQGEADLISMTDDEYIDKLDELLSKFHTDFPNAQNVPVLIGEFTPDWLENEPRNWTKKISRISALKNYANNNRLISFVESSGLKSKYASGVDTDPVQRIHFDAQSLVDMGRRYYDAWVDSFAANNPGSRKACKFNDTYVKDGTSIIAYREAFVPSGSSCVAETRVCSDGVLSGSYMQKSCRVAPSTNVAGVTSYNINERIGMVHAPGSLYNPFMSKNGSIGIGDTDNIHVDAYNDISKTGFRTLKIFDGPALLSNPSNIGSSNFFSRRLFTNSDFYTLFTLNFKNLFIVSDTLVMDDQVDARLLEQHWIKVYRQAYNLAYNLRTVFASENKSFFIQNHEADWHTLRNGSPTQAALDKYKTYFKIRQMAIQNARDYTDSNSTVEHVCEVVKVNEGDDVSTVVNTALRSASSSCDMIGYSAYEAYQNRQMANDNVDVYNNLNVAISYIKDVTGINRVSLTEFGIPDNINYPTEYLQNIANAVNRLLDENKIEYALYWTAYSNQCQLYVDGAPYGPWLRANSCLNTPDQGEYHIIGYWFRRPDKTISDFARQVLGI